MKAVSILLVQNLYHDPQGRALESTGGIAMAVILVFMFLVWAIVTGGDMGTHPDTGRPVKSLNTRPGKRAAQRRRYHENKYTSTKTVEERMEVAKSISDWEQSIRAMYSVKMEEADGNEEILKLIADREAEIALGAGAYYRKYGI